MSDHERCPFFSFVVGGLIGVTIGVLFAPRPGKQTRRKIIDTINEIEEQGIDSFEKAKEKVENIYEEGKDLLTTEKERVESVVEAGKKAYHKKDVK